MTLVRKVTAVLDRIIGFLAFAGAVLIIFTMLAVSFEVFMRYGLHRPTTWVFEITEYCMLYITLLGATWVLRREGHVKMDLVLNWLNPRNQALTSAITSIVGALICLVITIYGVKVAWTYIQHGYHSISPLMLPTGPVVAIIPAGFFLLFIQFLRRAHGYLRRQRVSRDKE